jgi:hypothetical protein
LRDVPVEYGGEGFDASFDEIVYLGSQLSIVYAAVMWV